MPTGIQPIFGRPGIGTAQVAQRRNVSRNGALDFYPSGGVIKGTKARDVGNSSYSTRALRAGLLMGKITSGGYWANSIFGLTNGALASNGTTVTFANAAIAVELARRVGTTGTFKLTGPPTAAGVVRTLTATYSALDTSGGTATITALGVNEVQTFNFANTPAGTFRLAIVDYNGVVQYTQRITYSATIATLLANLQAATDAVLAANAIVWSGTLVTAVAATFSGANYTALPQSLIVVDSDAETAGSVGITRTTAGVDGRFVTASLVQPTDGSETIRSIIPDGYGNVIPDDDSDVNFSLIPVAGTLDTTQILDYPADASLQAYVRSQLSTTSGGKWIFSDQF